MLEKFHALAAPRRLEILDTLRDGELAAGEIASRFDLARPTISHHLAVLEDAGLVRARREGTRRMYAIRPDSFESLGAYLESFWKDRLQGLKAAAERESGSDGR